MSSVFFTADTHFNHVGIVEHCHRAFADVDQMNEYMIERWNMCVSKRDTVYHLGDFGFATKNVGTPLDEIFQRLNGKKHLVVGNHDEKNKAVQFLSWESVSDLLTVRWEGVRFVCCHYPLESWKQMEKGYIHLHGHSHGNLTRVMLNRMDVGFDVWARPVEWCEIKSIFSPAIVSQWVTENT